MITAEDSERRFLIAAIESVIADDCLSKMPKDWHTFSVRELLLMVVSSSRCDCDRPANIRLRELERRLRLKHPDLPDDGAVRAAAHRAAAKLKAR